MSEEASNPGAEPMGVTTIAQLNDQLRANISSPGDNRITLTSGVAALIGDTTLFRGFHKRAELLRTIRDFDAFTPENDPFGEHDLGAFSFEDEDCFWKIDYYDLELAGGSSDPTDPAQTIRVLTIMRTDEW